MPTVFVDLSANLFVFVDRHDRGVLPSCSVNRFVSNPTKTRVDPYIFRKVSYRIMRARARGTCVCVYVLDV